MNRATRNTFYGLLLPQGVIPGVDGVPANNFGSVWDSGLGVLVTWQPFDFGLRAANVAAATPAREQAQATMNRTRYDVSVATADAFLTVVAAQQTAQAARAAVDSWQILLKSIHALVAAQLRPGADESRVQAELAAAQTQLAQAEQAIDVARSTVAQFVGIDPSQLNLNAGKLAERTATGAGRSRRWRLRRIRSPWSRTPRSRRRNRNSRRSERTYYPQFLVQGLAARARDRHGDRRLAAGRIERAGAHRPKLRHRAHGHVSGDGPVRDSRAGSHAVGEHSRRRRRNTQLIAANLQAQFNTALATLTGARRVAANTPVEVSSARTALQQATARYQSGLAPIDDVAQAQRLLVQAQIDDALARLNVWRALLQIATARGDIQPFLAQSQPMISRRR